MKYFEIFEEIISIMEKDYSGCEIKKEWGKPEFYKNLMKETYEAGKLDRNKFKEIVDDYILDFKDSHVSFHDNKLKKSSVSIGFKARRYEDALYVISASQEKNLKLGTKIIELDDVSIKELGEKFHRQLLDQPNERQLWDNIIAKYKTLTIIDGEKKSKFNINKYSNEDRESKYEFKRIDDATIMLSYNDFMNYELSQKLLTEHAEEVSSSPNIIIDVRVNGGGYDPVFLELLNYIFPENFEIVDEYNSLTNITERNYNNRKKVLDEYLEQDPNNEMAKEYMKELTINKNKGFVALEMEKGAYIVKGTKEAKKVVVLTDRYCGSSGDSFVIFASRSPWVTTIGRPTYGVIDFSNVAEEKFDDDFSLIYATSVFEGVKFGKGHDNVGVKPDIYIPWTPEHINKDIDLQHAIEFFKNK